MADIIAAAPHRTDRPLTSGREITAYLIAQIIRVGGNLVLSSAGTLVPLYQWAINNGGREGSILLSLTIGAIWLAISLPLFLAARSLVGAERLYPGGGEIGAYVLSHLIGLFAAFAVNSTLLTRLYAALIQGRQFELSAALGVTTSLVFAAVMFTLFIYFRRAFAATPGTVRPQPAPTHAPIHPSIHPVASSAAPVVVGPGIGGWLLFVCVAFTFLAPIAALTSIVGTLAQWPPPEVIDRFPGLAIALSLEIIVQLALAAFAIFTGASLWRIRPGAPGLAKTYLAIQLAVAILLPIIEIQLADLPSEANRAIFAEGAKGIAIALIAFAIWFTYFTRSTRVRATWPRVAQAGP